MNNNGNLAVTLCIGETVQIGDAMVTILNSTRSRARLSIAAPKEIRINRIPGKWTQQPGKATPPETQQCTFNTVVAGRNALVLTWEVEYTTRELPREVEHGDSLVAVEVEPGVPKLVAVNGTPIAHIQPIDDLVAAKCEEHWAEQGRTEG